MQICMGIIQMRPVDFWNLSPIEMWQIIKGFKSFHSTEEDRPMTQKELENMMELYPD